MFYPWTGTPTAPSEIQKICDSCPVRPDCLAEALDHNEVGVWGGTTENQRRAMKRHYRRKQCPSCRGPIISPLDDKQVCACCGLTWYALKDRAKHPPERNGQSAASETDDQELPAPGDVAELHDGTGSDPSVAYPAALRHEDQPSSDRTSQRQAQIR